ncbi:hypothetical protein [Mycobacterium sp. 236(2023)]|uniref:hypothetical protein n=1 Tax=Mycobacterium sp. 236(2023) TaxID=3038163 RepID=UPI002414D374|nr:hypothetical protein [Mycobacterium sp. 236(2023)]MDG4667412.1 hypothetical protein [Mycobacterium sp. 236(2023)]
MVVERGLTRCPRCVAVADYVFVETSQRPPNGLRYEVRCRKCGEYYSEDSRPVANLPAVVEESLRWPPDWLPEPARDWRGEAVEILTVVAQRGKTEMDALGKQVQSALELTRAWVNERNERRAARMLDQTGGYAGGG